MRYAFYSKVTTPGFDGWWKRTEFDPDIACDLDLFLDAMTKLYYGLASRYIAYFREVMYALTYNNGRMVYFTNHKYVLEIDEGKLQSYVTTSKDELVAAYDRYLPMIPQERVVACIGNMGLEFPSEDDARSQEEVISIRKNEELIDGSRAVPTELDSD